MAETIEIDDDLAILAAKAIRERRKKKQEEEEEMAEVWECTKCKQTFASEEEVKRHVEEEIEKEIAEEKRKALLWTRWREAQRRRMIAGAVYYHKRFG